MAITYGAAGQPLQTTTNFDALFSASLANYRKTLTDNISTSNFFFHKMKEMGLWEGRDGGLYLVEDLMYALSPVDTYDGYDELPLTPTEGITQAQYQWRQRVLSWLHHGSALPASRRAHRNLGQHHAWACTKLPHWLPAY